MDTILRLHFSSVDNIYSDEECATKFFDIADPGYIPQTGDRMYFKTEDFISDPVIADKIDEVMDHNGFKAKVWRIDYQLAVTVVSVILTSTEKFRVFKD